MYEVNLTYKTRYVVVIAILALFFALNPAMAFSQKIIAISAGGDHCLALADDGSVWQWGMDVLDDTSGGGDQYLPVRVPITDVKAISADVYHNLALKNDGTVWMWGQFPGSNNSTSTPVQIPVTNVKAIYSSSAGGFVIKDDNTVWGWGENLYGNIGDGTYIDRETPAQVIISDINSIAVRGGSSFAIKNDDTLWAWGNNVYDIMGDKTYSGRLGDDSSNETRPLPFMVNGVTGVISASAGQSHTLVLKDDGTVWAWGKGYYGQLGDGKAMGIFEYQNTPVKSRIENVRSISANGHQSMALKNDGTVWTWGIIGIEAESSEPKMVRGLNDVISISCGRSFFGALKSDGTVWTWGSNDHGQAGDGTKDSFKSSPVKVKFDFTNIPAANDTINPTLTQATDGNATGTMTPSQDNGWALRLLGFAGLIILAGGVLYLLVVRDKKR